jgi:hypothetical protein
LPIASQPSLANCLLTPLALTTTVPPPHFPCLQPNCFSLTSQCLNFPARRVDFFDGRYWHKDGLRLCACVSSSSLNCQAKLIVPQTSQVYHTCWHPPDTSLPALSQSHRLVQNWLFHLDCSRFNHSLGFLPDPARNMDVPPERNHWPDSVLNSCRRGILFRHTDIQYKSSVSAPEQTHFLSKLSSFASSERFRVPCCRTSTFRCVCPYWWGFGLERK